MIQVHPEKKEELKIQELKLMHLQLENSKRNLLFKMKLHKDNNKIELKILAKIELAAKKIKLKNLNQGRILSKFFNIIIQKIKSFSIFYFYFNIKFKIISLF